MRRQSVNWRSRLTEGHLDHHECLHRPGRHPVTECLPILAVDRGGNFTSFFHASPTQRALAMFTLRVQPTQVASRHGYQPCRWTAEADQPPLPLSHGCGGSPGIVDIVWLGSSATNPDVPSNWHIFFSQTTNAMSGSPLFSQVQVTTNVVHDQSICFNGSGCTGGPSDPLQNRDLLEYSPTVALDPDGNVNIVFSDSVNNGPAANCITNAFSPSKPAARAPMHRRASCSCYIRGEHPGRCARSRTRHW